MVHALSSLFLLLPHSLLSLPFLSLCSELKKRETESEHTHTITMLLGKRQRPPINRTTSLSEITFDLNLPGESDQHSLCQNSVMGPYGSTAAVDQQRGLLDQRLLAMVSPRGNLRRHSGDFSDAGHFLRSCSLCERLLVPGRDIYMYRGDTAFCSSECRQQQMAQDERKEKVKSAKVSTVAATVKAGKGERGAAAV